MTKRSLVRDRAAAVASDPRWDSIVSRDPSADESFFYSVRTTGVYCRPSCAARLARPENVQFHPTVADAEQAGFRPCKRCQPNQPTLAKQHAATIEEACRLIERSPDEPSLNDLAVFANISIFHFHRLFRATTGVTPKQYAAANRGRSIQQELRKTRTVTEAIYSAGFNSSGRFYANSNQVLGMTPCSFKAAGEKAQIRFAVGECSLGSILVAQSDRGICAILLGDDPELLLQELQERFSRASLIGGDHDFEQLIAQVIGFVEEPARSLDLPLDIRGTAFQQRVWLALRELPVGSTASYSDIARAIGLPQSARAVAQACAANTLAIAIPCHRVIRSDGQLSGYRWGIERKRFLLERETQE